MYHIEHNFDCLSTTVLRSLIWEGIKSNWRTFSSQATDSISLRAICAYIYEVGVKKGLLANQRQGAGQYEITTNNSSLNKVSGVLWELINQNIFFPSYNNGELIVHLTDYGKKMSLTMAPIPHDPDGYLLQLTSEINNIDSVVYRYVQESIHAYNINLILSAMTSIGCAAEKLLLLLIDAFIKYISSESERKAFIAKTKNRFVKNQFEELRKSLNGHFGSIKSCNKELIDGFDIVVSGLFELLRQNRNSTGHPTGKEISRAQVFACLQVFIMYCKQVYALIDFFNSHTPSDTENEVNP